MYLIDTDVAIHLRDSVSKIVNRTRRLTQWPAVSLMTLVELEGGIASVPELASLRRASTAILLSKTPVLGLNAAVVEVYSQILKTTGYNRRRVIDRLIAATAIVNDLTLATINADDFRDIPGLRIEIWPAPAQ